MWTNARTVERTDRPTTGPSFGDAGTLKRGEKIRGRNKAVATATVACGWAGAVICGAGAVGGAVYTRASVTCDWAGAVMRKPLAE